MKQLKIFGIIVFVVTFFLGCKGSKKTTNSNANANTTKQNKLNVILIVADDLGRNDLACYGNKFIETPALNNLAAEGQQFNNAYCAAPLCSPTRASIITGNNPARINLTEHLHGYAAPGPKQKLVTPKIETGLPSPLITIPEVLNNYGYATAHFGKWHLGAGPSSPAAQGYKKVYGGGVEGLPKTFFYPFFNGSPYKDLLQDTKAGDYLDDALTTKAIDYIGSKKDSNFFVALNFYAPHVPIEGKPNLVAKYKEKRTLVKQSGLPEDEYAAMVENIDYNVGRLINYLKQSGLDKNTVVIFTSDNGGLDVEEVPAFAKHTPPTNNLPYKGGKGSIYEGGIKAPLIIWGATIEQRNNVTSLVSSDDIFNTVMQFAGAKELAPDGVAMQPVLSNMRIAARKYFLHFPHYSPQRGKPGAVMIYGQYKLIEWYENNTLELYDLSVDMGEQNNLAKQYPDKVNEMKLELDAWRKNLKVKMPTLNPIYEGDKN
jgi:arylsulfatase A